MIHCAGPDPHRLARSFADDEQEEMSSLLSQQLQLTAQRQAVEAEKWREAQHAWLQERGHVEQRVASLVETAGASQGGRVEIPIEKIEGRGSRVQGPGSRVEGRESRVESRESRV
eukprot:2117599-Rhodomonas_salina.4